MAQACVMVQRNLEGATGQTQCVLTPAPPASAAPDASFITSSVRKRKDPREGETAGDKRARPDPASPSALPPLAEAPEAPDAATPAEEGDGILFSPTFHLLDKETEDGGSPPAPPSRPDTPPADNASTDASTGTSLDHGAALAVAPAAPTSPSAPPPPPPEDDDDAWEFDPFVFIKRLPALDACIPPRTSFLLPRQTRHSFRKTLVLDLDETLVHSTLDGDCDPDFTFAVQMGTVRHMVAVRMRPHLQVFLEAVASRFEVVVFTASQQIYAEQLLDIIDPGQKLIKHRIYRDSCVLWEGNYLKDLTVLGRDLAHTLIIDNSPQAFGFQLENGVPIESWYDDDEDTELLKLLPFLEEVATAVDVRPLIQRTFRLRDMVDAAVVPQLEHLEHEQCQ